MRYLSLCSGIEAATVAWHPLGWSPVAFGEIEKFPSAVLAHHYPHIPNLGDMTKHEQWKLGPGSIDLLVAGTPCQSFSVAGLRRGLADPRGNLALTYLAIADRLRPRWLVWENVPGVLSSSNGRDFGSFLGALSELGYGWAYRVLDAQFFGVAQRRRRVFVVGHAGDWRRAAAVLFERESLRGDPAPSRAARQEVAGTLAARTGECRNNHEHIVGSLCARDSKGVSEGKCVPMWWDGGQVAETLNQSKCGGAGVSMMPDKGNFGAVLSPVGQPVTYGIYGGNKRIDRPDGGFYVRQEDTARTLDAAHGLNPTCSQGGNVIAQPVAIQGNLIGRDAGGPHGVGASDQGTMYTLTKADVHGVAHPVPYDLFQITAPVNRQNRKPGDPCHTLARDNAAHAAVAFTRCDNGRDASVEVTPTMRCGSNYSAHLAVAMVNMQGSKSNAVAQADGPSYTLNAMHGHDVHAVAFTPGNLRRAAGSEPSTETFPTIKSSAGDQSPCVAIGFNPDQSAKTRSMGEREQQAPTLRAGAEAAVAFSSNMSVPDCQTDGTTPTVKCGGSDGGNPPAVAFRDPSPTLTARMQGSSGWAPANEDAHLVGQPNVTAMAVRRLTPVECERLQGFPDGYTAIPWRGKAAEECPDGPRYRALGNSMAVPVMRWIGERIAKVDAIRISVTGDDNVQ